MSTPSEQKHRELLQEPNRRLAHILEAMQMTQAQVADAVGISRTYLSQVKSGRKPVTPDTALAFEAALGYQAEWILHGTGPYRIAEGGPEYMVGPLSKTNPAPSAVSVISRTAYHCGGCHGEVSLGLEQCPHCGAHLRWIEGNCDAG